MKTPMTRQRKFRAFDEKENKGMLYSDDYPDLQAFFCLAQGQCGERLNPVMDFTDLLDKNGKEIYEGDIVRCFDTSGEKVYDREVDFYGFRTEIWSDEVNGRTKVEIIGNVWENPELLTK